MKIQYSVASTSINKPRILDTKTGKTDQNIGIKRTYIAFEILFKPNVMEYFLNNWTGDGYRQVISMKSNETVDVNNVRNFDGVKSDVYVEKCTICVPVGRGFHGVLCSEIATRKQNKC